jgi:hypothetical protein
LGLGFVEKKGSHHPIAGVVPVESGRVAVGLKGCWQVGAPNQALAVGGLPGLLHLETQRPGRLCAWSLGISRIAQLFPIMQRM